MKDLTLLALISQLGLTVALPLVGFIVLSLWLRDSCGWGQWVVAAGIVLGLLAAIEGFVSLLKTMARLSRDKKQDEPPSVSFHDHD